MKRTLSLWLGLLAFALIPAWAQQVAAPTGKIHGHVINPVGEPQTSGTVSLTTGSGVDKATFNVDENGEFSGDAPPGNYTLVFRNLDTAKTQRVDQIENVRIVAGQTTEQDDDMGRPAFLKNMTDDQRKQLEELKKHNAAALKANVLVKKLNADLKTAGDNIKAADAATAAATQQLGAGATRQAISDKANEIRTTKFTAVESMMTKDTALKPEASILWASLGQAQLGLKKYDDAETSFKKALDLESTAKKPLLDVQGLAQSGIGEAYARQNKVQEANDAFDAAAKLNPAQAAFFYTNEAKIFYRQAQSSGDPKIIAAQVEAADKAISAKPDPKNPNTALLYYLKGQGMISAPGAVQEDPKTHKLTAPPGTLDVFQKYLELAPDGQFAADVKGILSGFNAPISSTYKAGKKK